MTSGHIRAADERFDSWKAIADYLKRDVATARRWEKELGLPVHRVPGGPGRSVFAYRSDIDAWLSGPHSEATTRTAAPPPRMPLPSWLAWGATAFLTGAVGAVLPVGRPTMPQSVAAADLVAERLWSGPDVDATGSISRDGRLLSYVDWQRTGNLMLRNLITGDTVALTHKKSWVESPEFSLGSAISPDGRYIAFGWMTAAGHAELRIAEPSGRPVRTVYARPDLEGIWPFDWSPNGHQVVALLVENSARNRLALIDVSTGDIAVLKEFDWRTPERAFFSPHGTHVAYDVSLADDPRDREVVVLTTDGAQEFHPAVHRAEDRVIGWTPAGALLFASNRSGPYGLWQLTFDGARIGPAQLVKADVGRMSPLGVTREGAVIYAVASKLRELGLARLDPASATLVEPTRAAAVWLPAGVHEWRVAWSPRGRSIGVVPTRGGARGSPLAIVIDVTTGEQRHVPINFDSAAAFAWTPDGRGLYIAGRRQGQRGVFQVDLTDGATRAIRVDETIGHLTVSPDGGALYLSVYGKDPGILALDVASGATRWIYRGPAWDVAAAPDGRRLAVIAAGHSKLSVAVVSLEDGSIDVLYSSVDEGLGALGWSADGSRLFFATQTGDQLWTLPIRERRAQHTGLSAASLTDVSVHADGARVALTFGTSASEVWRLDGIAPDHGRLPRSIASR